MSTSSTRSITAKLSYLMTFVVLATVAALTIQSSQKFSSYIVRNIEESSTSMAERTAADLSATIENWVGQISVITSKLSNNKVDPTKDDEELGAPLRSDKDLLALALYTVDVTEENHVPRGISKLLRKAEQHSTATVDVSNMDAVQRFAKMVEKNPNVFVDDRAVVNSSAHTKAATILIGVKFSIPDKPNKFAMMVLVASPTKIQISLPQSRFISSYAVTTDGRLFASTDESQMKRVGPQSDSALVRQALMRKSPSGFLADFKDKNSKQKLGAFAQVPGKNRIFVIVERDRKAAFQIVTRTYVTSILWGLLILLIAAMGGYLAAGSLTKHLRELVAATKRISNGDFGVRLQPQTSDEVAELGFSVNNMASRIQTLMSTEVEKARFEKELETAKMVQSTFFPKQDFVSRNLEVTGSYQPATECGGDLWGHYTVRDGVELVYIADAMGHGAPAALVTAIAYAVCQSVSSIISDYGNVDPSPTLLLNRLNHIILDAVDGKISMTFFAALFDFNNGTIRYANAGHNFPFILTANPNDSRIGKAAKKSFVEGQTSAITLTLQGNPLGVDRTAEFKEKTIEMAAGDKLFFFTDGLIENHLGNQNPMGRKTLIETVSSIGVNSIGEIKSNILSFGEGLYGKDNLQDDVTIVVAEINRSWVKKAPQEAIPFTISLPAA